jgi:hypothetical protein
MSSVFSRASSRNSTSDLEVTQSSQIRFHPYDTQWPIALKRYRPDEHLGDETETDTNV